MRENFDSTNRLRNCSSEAERRDGDHVGPRRHHFADALVAELDHLLDHARLIVLQNPLFRGGFHERFDGLLLGLRSAVLAIFVGDIKERHDQIQNRVHRPDRPQEHANCRDQRRAPSPRGPRHQHVGNELHRENDFDAQERHHLHRDFPRAGHEEQHAPRGLDGYKHEPHAAQQAEGGGRAVSLQVKPRFDIGFEHVQVLVNAMGRDASHLAIDTIEIGEDDEACGQTKYAESVEKDRHDSG